METVDALVDTGSSYSVFPRTMLERLGIRRLERVGFEQADGSIVELDVGVAWMTISGRERASSVAFGRDDSEALLGANALQEFLLVADPVEERLVPRTGRLKLQGGG
jgi:predicted aspartyl protease